MDRVTAGGKGCIIQILDVIILSVLTVENDGVGVDREELASVGRGQAGVQASGQ